jgi:acetyltransferase-like isoleucine patch superfamily enzyme
MDQQSSVTLNAVGDVAPERQSLRRYLATSDRPFPKLVRFFRKRCTRFSVPAPRVIVKPMLWAFLAVRSCWHFVLRVFVCEPIMKAYFKECGRNFRGDCHFPWISGNGDIIVGDNVEIDGMLYIHFGVRFKNRPTLIIGDNSGIGHDCRFVVANQIKIGRDCVISGNCWIADSNGHPADPADRLARKPPSADEVRPVVISDGVWIGRCCLIFPGVKIGTGSIVSGGSVVRGHVPPYSVVAGNPAKVVFRMKRPALQTQSTTVPPATETDGSGPTLP